MTKNRFVQNVGGMLFTALALVLLLHHPARSQEAVSRPRPGDKAPEFALSRLDGTTVRLAALRERGPVVVLILRGWIGYQCPICQRQVGQYLGAARDFQSLRTSVVLVYPGPPDVVRPRAEDFVTGKTLPDDFHFVIDPDLTAINAFGVRWKAPDQHAYPSTFVVDAKGTVRFAHVGASAGDRPPVAQVLEAVRRLE
jgi:peroxiredoxin